MYAIPYDLYRELQLRKYGFHGTSHHYIAKKGGGNLFSDYCDAHYSTAKTLGGKLEDFRLITLHLGNGSSVTAIKFGKSIDTSMGLTPLQG